MAHLTPIELPRGVAKNIDGFTGRVWLLPHILNWWDKGDDRLFLLTGDAFTGKSMIVAWLAGHGPAPAQPEARARLKALRKAVKAVHFCQDDSRNVSPQAFAVSVANSLTDSVKGFSDALAATVAARVSIVGTAQAGYAASGSNLTGVVINRIDLGTLDDNHSFDSAFTQPIKKLYASGYSEPMLLLVDALNEAQTYTGQVTLPQLLSGLADLPPQVRLLATTRHDPRVLKFFREVTPFDLIKDAAPDVDDVRTYAEGRLADLSSIKAAERSAFAQRLSSHAGGMFLYAALLLDELLGQPSSTLPALDTYPLPKGLREQYHASLTRDLGKDDQRWFDLFEPLLGLIAVSQGKGLTSMQLAAIVAKDIRAALRACKQHLTGELPDGPFRLWARAFSDFLLEDEGNVDYHVDAQRMHERIVAYYRAGAGSWATVDWNNVDAYGLLHLVGHLFALSSDATYRSQLYEIANRPVVLAKWQRFGSLESLASDLRIAMNVAVQERPLNWIDFMRCYLLERTLDSFELSADLLGLIASTAAQNGPLKDARKIIDQALEVASRIQASAEKARALSTIAAFLFNAGAEGDAQEVVDRALAETKLIKNVGEKSQALSALVLNMARVHDPARAKDVACQALALAQSIDFSWARAVSISSVACVLSQVGGEVQASEAFSQALKAAWDVEDNDDRAYALCAVAAAMEQAGDKEGKYVFRDASSQLYGCHGMPPEEIEDEFNSIYVDYRAKSGDPEALFAVALGIRDRAQRGAALRSLAERMAKMVLFGNYPRQLGEEPDSELLCDRATFLSIASEEADPSIVSERKFTLRGLCQAILDVDGRFP